MNMINNFNENVEISRTLNPAIHVPTVIDEMQSK